MMNPVYAGMRPRHSKVICNVLMFSAGLPVSMTTEALRVSQLTGKKAERATIDLLQRFAARVGDFCHWLPADADLPETMAAGKPVDGSGLPDDVVTEIMQMCAGVGENVPLQSGPSVSNA